MSDFAHPAAAEPPRKRPALKMLASLVVHGGLFIASVLMLYPLLWMLSASFRPADEIFSVASLIPSSVTLDAYARGWTGLSVGFDVFFINSLEIAVLAIVGNLLAGSLTAFALSRLNFFGRRFWFAMMLLTMMLPYHAQLIPQYVLFLKLGWVNTILPLVVPKFLAVDSFFIFLMIQFFRSIPGEIQEAAMMDGCSPWRIYWKIMLPLSLPVLATAAVFTFMFTWEDFLAPLVYLGDIRSYTVQLGLRTFVDSNGLSDWGAVFAMSNLALVPVFVVFILFQRLLIEGIATTGMKR